MLVSAWFTCTYISTCSFADMTHICSAWFTHCGHLLCRLCLLDLHTHTLACSLLRALNTCPLAIFVFLWSNSFTSVFLSLVPNSILILQKWKSPFPVGNHPHALLTAKQPKPKPKTHSLISAEITSILGFIIFCLQ